MTAVFDLKVLAVFAVKAPVVSALQALVVFAQHALEVFALQVLTVFVLRARAIFALLVPALKICLSAVSVFVQLVLAGDGAEMVVPAAVLHLVENLDRIFHQGYA